MWRGAGVEQVGGGRVYGEYNKGPVKVGGEWTFDEDANERVGWRGAAINYGPQVINAVRTWGPAVKHCVGSICGFDESEDLAMRARISKVVVAWENARACAAKHAEFDQYSQLVEERLVKDVQGVVLVELMERGVELEIGGLWVARLAIQ